MARRPRFYASYAHFVAKMRVPSKMNFQILFDLGTMNREGPWAGGLIFPQVWTAALIQLPPLKIIMQTAKFNGVNPQACLLQTLTKVSEGHLIRRVDAMLR